MSRFAAHGLSDAEYAVLYHVNDTLVVPRDELVDWVSANLTSHVAQDLTVDDLGRALDALLARKLLIELTESDIAADQARWQAETRPVSWGVDRRQNPGDVDITGAGARIMDQLLPRTSPRVGYDDRTPELVRVLGETEAACRGHLDHMRTHVLPGRPFNWAKGALVVGELRHVGPWWVDRHHLVADGYELPVTVNRFLRPGPQ